MLYEKNLIEMSLRLNDNNLIEMSLRLNRSGPSFRTIRELPGIGRRPRTRDDIRLQRNLPISFLIVRQKPTLQH